RRGGGSRAPLGAGNLTRRPCRFVRTLSSIRVIGAVLNRAPLPRKPTIRSGRRERAAQDPAHFAARRSRSIPSQSVPADHRSQRCSQRRELLYGGVSELWHRPREPVSRLRHSPRSAKSRLGHLSPANFGRLG